MISLASRELSPAVADVLKHVLELFAVEQCTKYLADIQRVIQYIWNAMQFFYKIIFILQFTTIKENDIRALQNKLEELLAKIRPNAVSIVDSFDIPDKVLASPLGAYDGNVYERLYEEALKSPLNQVRI